jgi:hypothetical protein
MCHSTRKTLFLLILLLVSLVWTVNACDDYIDCNKGAPSASPPGGGYCSGLGGCLCQTGFSGPNCQIASCNNVASNNPTTCNSNGVCYGYNLCNCTLGWAGTYCTSCATSWSGPSCQYPNCFGRVSTDPLVCSGHGS